mmetsp:Transcript_21753/g.27714  ORF Transcript_21753/g.27714 Transcript_21753/m.27714 type:complete len:749 (-) Transcript_21753:68-2314(-)
MSQRGNSSARGKSKTRGKKRGNTNKQSTEGRKDGNKTQNTRGNKEKQRGGSRGGKSRGTNKKKGNSTTQRAKSGSDPVEKGKITVENPLSGQKQTRDLLSKAHAIMDEFLCFLPPDNDINLLDTLNNLTFMNKDLSALLKCKFYEFWSTVTFNSSFRLFLDSFLRYWTSYNALDDPKAQDELCFNNRKEIMRPEVKQRRLLFLNVWKVIYRLTHPNETSTDWMSNYHYASLIRTQEIITIPTMIDICRHYSVYQRKGVMKIMNFLFEVQPSYYNDLGKALEHIQSTLEQFVGNVQSFVKQIGDKKLEPDTATSLWETIQFLYSILTSLLSFIEVSPDEVLIHLNDRRSLRGQFVILYELIIPQLKNLASSVDLPNPEEAMRMVKITQNADYALFSHFLNNCFITPLTKIQRIEDYDQEVYSNEFIKILGSLEDYSYRNFGKSAGLLPPEREEKILYHLVDDLSLVQVVCSFSNYFQSIDELELGDVLKIIQPYSNATQDKKEATSTKFIHVEAPVGNASSTNVSQPITTSVTVPAVTPERQEKINNVKNILDFLGEGFINECLELYNDDVAIVCDRILSENLAEPLLELDRNLPLSTKTITTTHTTKNVDIPAAAPLVGSQLPVREFIEVPDESSSFHIGKMKKLYEKQEDEEFREINKRFYKNVYDDEYDDSMDQYARFEVDDGETEDERVSLTESGEYEQHEDTEQNTPAVETPPASMSRKNKRKFQQRQRNKVKVSDTPSPKGAE